MKAREGTLSLAILETEILSDWAADSLQVAEGRGVKRFAREVLMRSPSTIYRWLSGALPIPKCFRDYLIGKFRILASPP